MIPRAAVSLVAVVTFSAPAALAFADDEGPACGSPPWVQALLAVDAWCKARTPVERGYYDWSLARTKKRACGDLKVALFTCKAELWKAEAYQYDGKPGDLVVRADYPDGVLTYWEARLAGSGRAFQVTTVDFMEDCTGP
jgi:hypothetical protein